jgi:predicted amidophosphoribosyltransferase
MIAPRGSSRCPAPAPDHSSALGGDGSRPEIAARRRRGASTVTGLGAQLLALVAPPSCVSCRAPVPVGERLCVRCTRALPWLRRGCPRCALPTHRGRPCPAGGAAFPRAWAPLAYEGVARDLVAALKFRGALPVADLMAAHMAANLPAALRTPTPGEDGGFAAAGPNDAAGLAAAIVPVPTVAARRRRRGFDPAGVLAAALARRLERPLVACLERRDRAPRQVGAGRRIRRAPGRLELVARAPPPLVLLVDDVHTTGATLDAAARALAAEGATVLAALSYARTL